jgi:hypothetical protein
MYQWRERLEDGYETSAPEGVQESGLQLENEIVLWKSLIARLMRPGTCAVKMICGRALTATF